MISKEDDREIEEMELNPDGKKSSVEGRVMCDVVKVNHGNVFNTGSWYTFYCPHCKRQIGKMGSENKCCWCEGAVNWD